MRRNFYLKSKIFNFYELMSSYKQLNFDLNLIDKSVLDLKINSIYGYIKIQPKTIYIKNTDGIDIEKVIVDENFLNGPWVTKLTKSTYIYV